MRNKTGFSLHTLTLCAALSALGLAACEDDGIEDELIEEAEQNEMIDGEDEATSERGWHHQRGHHGKKMMAKLDVDQDGAISASEAEGSWLEKKFEKLDADQDGSLTKDELHAFKKQMRDPAARAAHVMSKLDADQDGKITAAEVEGSHFAEKFEMIDANADGEVDLDELVTFKESHRGKRHGKHGKRHGKHHDGEQGGEHCSPEIDMSNKG